MQGTVPPTPPPPPPCTPTMHPTVLTLNVSPPNTLGDIVLTGMLTDTCTGLGVAGATITLTGTGTNGGALRPLETDATGTFNLGFPPLSPPGTYTIQAHFAGQGIFGPSNSATETYTH